MGNCKLHNQVVFSEYTGSDGTLYIPQGVTHIGYCGHNKTVKRLIIPEGVTEIGAGALESFPALESLHLPKSLGSFAAQRHMECPSLLEITVAPGNSHYIAKNNCLIDTVDGELVLGCQNSILPDDGSVQGIGDHAFANAAGLNALRLPKSVRWMDRTAFCGCSALESLTVDPENENYYSKDNCIISTKFKSLVLGCKTSRIPDDGSVEAILAQCFAGNTALQEIVIPEGVTAIGKSAFDGCLSLERVTLPQSLRAIGVKAFSFCQALQQVSLGTGLSYIGAGAFQYCEEGLTFDFHGTVQQWDAIYKTPGWAASPDFTTGQYPQPYRIRCTDGEIAPNNEQGERT